MFLGNTFDVLENGLDYATAKNKVISNNIANVDTPHFKSKSVSFRNILSQELNKDNQFIAKRTHPKHMTFDNNKVKPYQINTRSTTTYNHNGNNVDIDKEMTILAENQIYYRALVNQLNTKFNNIDTVLRGGS